MVHINMAISTLIKLINIINEKSSNENYIITDTKMLSLLLNAFDFLINYGINAINF